MSAYGGRASTPRIDALAARGARFTFAHAHAVVTLPSHTSLLTGVYPYQHGVRDNNGYRVKPDTTTLAMRMKRLGFATAAFVGGFPLDQRFGLNAGFDVYDDRIGETGSTVDFALPERRADAVVSSALAWAGTRSDKWFAWVHLFDPHAPYQPPDEFARRYAEDPYAGEIAWTDYALGPLFDRLSSSPAQDPRDHHRRPRREPRRPWRVDAWDLRLRADASGAADCCGTRRRNPTRDGRDDRRGRASCGSRPYHSRVGRRGPRRQPAGRIAGGTDAHGTRR